MLNVEECIQKFKDFESRCSDKRSEQIRRIKDDRDFLAGGQWDDDDGKLIAKSRPRRTINITSNSIHSVVNQYANYPFKWYTDDEDCNAAGEAFLNTGSNARAALDGLENSVSFGLGYMCLGSEPRTRDGVTYEIPALYSMERVENVYFDPDSIDPTGADAMEAAIVEMRSKTYVRAKYGEEWVTAPGVKAIVNVSDNRNADTMCIVTYYRIENGSCVVYSLLNNDFLEDPKTINLDRVPIFPIYGEKTWHEDTPIYQGLVSKARPIQKVVNYAFTQLAERLAIAPKPVFLTNPEAVEGYDDGYRNFHNNLNPLLLWNKTNPDNPKEVCEKPERMNNEVQFGDITGIISSNLELMATITGVDARGILDNRTEVTATEVIYNERQVQTTIRHFFANLRDSFKAVGEAVFKLLGMGDVNVDVIQGPNEYMEKQVARQELIQLCSIVPETERMKLVDGILLSHNDNGILRNVFGALHGSPQPTPMEQQAFDTIEQMKAALEEKNAQIQELTDTVKRYETGAMQAEKSTRADFAMADLKHQQKMEEMVLQAQLENGKDGAKVQADAIKAQMGLEEKAIQLDTAKVKAAAEIAKAAAPAATPATMEGV